MRQSVGWAKERAHQLTNHKLCRARTEMFFLPISASDQNFNPRNTLCIPAVQILIFPDVAKKNLHFRSDTMSIN
jgi:hypothetical protein